MLSLYISLASCGIHGICPTAPLNIDRRGRFHHLHKTSQLAGEAGKFLIEVSKSTDNFLKVDFFNDGGRELHEGQPLHSL